MAKRKIDPTLPYACEAFRRSVLIRGVEWDNEKISRDMLIDQSWRQSRFEPIDFDCLPKAFWPNARERKKTMPHIALPAGIHCVSQEVRDVMVRFDLGPMTFGPVRMLQRDKKTTWGRDLFIMNGWAHHSAVDRAPHSRETEIRGIMRIVAKFVIEDGEIVLRAGSVPSVDIWYDEGFMNIFFVSGRLMQALDDAGLSKIFDPLKCAVE